MLKMLKRLLKHYSLKLLFSVLVFALFIQYGALAQAAPERQTYTITETQLQTLKNNSNNLMIQIDSLENIIQTLENDLNDQTELSATLNQQVQTLKQQVKELKQQQAQALNDLEKQKILLDNANQQLQMMSESIKKSQNKLKITERQRDFWEILSVVVSGILISKG